MSAETSNIRGMGDRYAFKRLILLPGPVVSAGWLATHLEQPRLVLLDASLTPERHEIQLPRTRIFDFDKKICDRTSELPHMMPTPDLFQEEVRKLGINQDSVIVTYDRSGVYSSPRARLMFKAMGHDHIAVLDGGLPAWLKAGLPTQPVSPPPAVAGDFLAKSRPGIFCDADQVMAALLDKRHAVIDARSEKRFHGHESEPRPGLRGGHMPNALNLPFARVQTQGQMRPCQEIEEIFSSLVDRKQKLILTCGSGVTACILALAAELAGYTEITVYDGSWSEWGLPSSRPVVL